MSTGPRKQAAFIQGNQSTIEHDSSHSALFYLFQEVSKLASPVHDSFMDTNPPSAWLHETSRQAPLVVKKEEEDGHLFKISNGSCQYSLSPCKQMKKVKEDSHSSKVTTMVEPHPNKCNSPWKVLSLINRQCERLLHQDDVASEPSLLSSTTKFGHLIDKSSTATADVTDQGVDGDCVSVECTLRPSLLICERQQIPACHSLVEGVRGDCRARSYKPQCRVKDSKVGCCVQSQAAGNVSLLTVDRQCECNQECKRVSSEQGVLHAPCSEKFFQQTRIPYAFLDAQLTFNSKEDANVTLSLDHNANLTLTAEPPCDTQLPPPNPVLPPRSAPLLFGTTEKCQSLAKKEDKIAEPECTYECTNLSLSATSKTEQRPLQKEEIASPSPQQWRTKTPRKQPHPRRSADIQDPDFQGVTFRMDTEMDDNMEQCRLLITSNYSKELRKSVRKPRLRKRTSQRSSKTSSSDEDLTASVSISKEGKACASCCTRKTPMWRDAEDGTPLCNACGIRYKKYRVRCVKCWHIPRKEGNSNSCCLKCGNFVRLTSAQRKRNA